LVRAKRLRLRSGGAILTGASLRLLDQVRMLLVGSVKPLRAEPCRRFFSNKIRILMRGEGKKFIEILSQTPVVRSGQLNGRQ
jgi:hypothetical protein